MIKAHFDASETTAWGATVGCGLGLDRRGEEVARPPGLMTAVR